MNLHWLSRFLDWVVALLAWPAEKSVGRLRASPASGETVDSMRAQLVWYVALVAPALALGVLVPELWWFALWPVVVAACVGAMWLHAVERLRRAIRSQAEPELRHNFADPLFKRVGLFNLAVAVVAIFPGLVCALSHQWPELRALFAGRQPAAQYWAALAYSFPDFIPGDRVAASEAPTAIILVVRVLFTALVVGAFRSNGEASRILDSLEDIGRHNPNLAAALAWSNGGDWAVDQGKRLVRRAYGSDESHDDDPKTSGGDELVYFKTALEIAERDNSPRSLAIISEVATKEAHRKRLGKWARKTLLSAVAEAFSRWSRSNAAVIRADPAAVDRCAHALLRAYVDGGAVDDAKAHFTDWRNLDWLVHVATALRASGHDPAAVMPDSSAFLRDYGAAIIDLAPALSEPVATT